MNAKVADVLHKCPYALYTFVLFYNQGNLIQAIECLKLGVLENEGCIGMLVYNCSTDRYVLDLSQFVCDIENDLEVLKVRIKELKKD